ncbi:MAG: helix-turn-helix domain-containing protein [Syntrophothermus sp.]|uniref:helix-turn-helix domain-containing protein n=1 Tax=Syntrophothermus sp. TaxID=2736299 RepID=UPI00257CDFCC|nr:helix-turn-helix domain-containing protein [Syntrophothermus sp.]NSW83150.1 helix-turn-helix domain-containing protein [Syntrophothermus sp.]
MYSEEYSLKDAAKLANCSVKTLRNHIKNGKLVARVRKGKHGEEYRILRADLEIYLGRTIEKDSRDLARVEGITATVATQQVIQQAVFNSIQPLTAKVDSLIATLENMGKRLEELESLRSELAAAREVQERIERNIEERDRKLTGALRTLGERKERQTWWRRIFS